MNEIKEKKSLAIIASLGFAIRNFVLGKFLNHLHPKLNIYLFSSLAKQESFVRFVKEKGIQVFSLPEIDLNNKWRKAKSIRDGLHVAYVNNETWKLKRSEVHHDINLKDKIKGNLIMSFLKIIKGAKTLQFFDKLETKFALKSKTAEYYFDLFKKIKPSLVFSTCPLMPIEWIPIQVAREMGIKTALYILSWDNLSTKQRPPLPVDFIFVWNKNMEKELKKWYPGSEKAELIITSSPQFDFYFDPDFLLSKEEFFKKFNLDPSKPLIVYSGVTPSLMPEEDLIVERLIEDIKSRKVINEPQLLVRLHPKDDGTRYKRLREKYKDVAFSIPGERSKGNIMEWAPDFDEIKNLVNIVNHCNVLINVASTMTIDSALLDKPVINVRYYFSKNNARPPWGIYIYQTTHYSPLVSTGGFRIADTPEDLINYINLYLENPGLDREGRKKIVDLVCGSNVGKASEKIANAISKILE